MTTKISFRIAALTSLIALSLMGCDQAPTSRDPKVSSQTSATEPQTPSKGIVLSVLGVANAKLVSVGTIGRFYFTGLDVYKLVPTAEVPSGAKSVSYFKPALDGVEGHLMRAERTDATVACHLVTDFDPTKVHASRDGVAPVRIFTAQDDDSNCGGQSYLLFPEQSAGDIAAILDGYVFQPDSFYDSQLGDYYYAASSTKSVRAPSAARAIDLVVDVTNEKGDPVSGLAVSNFKIETDQGWMGLDSAQETSPGRYMVRGFAQVYADYTGTSLRVRVISVSGRGRITY